MLDSFVQKRLFQLLIDQETFGVLASVSSISVLQALAAGIENSSVMVVNLPGANINLDILKDINVILGRKSVQALIPSEINVAKTLASVPGDNMFGIVSMSEPTSSFIEKKTLAIARATGLINLEQKIERYLVRAKFFCGDEIFIPFIAEELKKHESLPILEWARIQDISEEAARKDLEIKVKSAQLITLRLSAVWEKYVKRINALNSFEEIDNCVKYDLEIELRSGVQ
jgi:hypothetical protein